MRRLLKGAAVGLGAIVISTIAIQASDVFRGIEGNLTGLVSESDNVCGNGAVLIQLGSHSICVDIYEASGSQACPHAAPGTPAETSSNLLETDCRPESKVNVLPWRFVSFSEAQQLCARAEKRLPTNEEWHRLGLSVQDQKACAVNKNNPQLTGSVGCVSTAGIHDLVGNVWEWLDESVTNGEFQGRKIPETGYVRVVDNNGIVIETGDTPEALYGEDFAWTNEDGIFGVIRGGFYGGEDDAGIYAQNLAVPFDLRTNGLGFRCVRDI